MTFPRSEFVYRSYLVRPDQLERLKKQYEKQLHEFNYLRKIENSKLTDVTFEEFYFPSYHSKSLENYRNLKRVSADEILEKYAVLSYIVGNDFLKHINCGVNYFDFTIFKDIIKAKYPTFEEMMMKFSEIEEKYRKFFTEFHNKEIERILFIDNEPTRTRSSRRFLKLQQHLFEIEAKPKYVNSLLEDETQTLLMINLIFKHIEASLIERLKNKTIDSISVMRYKHFLEGNMMPQNIDVAKKLFVEANEKLQFFKLSHKFGDHRHYLVQQMFNHFSKGKSLKGELERLSLSGHATEEEIYNFESFSERFENQIELNKGEIENAEIYKQLGMNSGHQPGIEMNEEAGEIYKQMSSGLLGDLKFQITNSGDLSMKRSEISKLKKVLQQTEEKIQSDNPELFKKIQEMIEKTDSPEDLDFSVLEEFNKK